ncbi:MAG: Rieske 2Fe-2S domain-containing protein [Xanthomonadales bacterium]|nr:Rieske 2Fe-2S domain-containing protein [Gammaproteobacteria bacterium]NNK02963.1 Rieske 2Fe-2S domain-containing protein [Xanthomonadales bacterium]NNL00432.1 Rieske 2Fe-2S domain-containing protein [Xanthomonadales bacterium]
MDKETSSRRSFLNKLWLVLGGVAFAELLAMVFAFFRPRTPRGTTASEASIITAGAVDNFEPETVTAFVRGKFYLARLEDGGFLAMSRRCTHLSCTVPWVASDNKFICPCHSSEFDIRGEVANPPAPRALDLYRVEIQNNVVRVDTSKAERRSVFAANQVTYPKKA